MTFTLRGYVADGGRSYPQSYPPFARATPIRVGLLVAAAPPATLPRVLGLQLHADGAHHREQR